MACTSAMALGASALNQSHPGVKNRSNEKVQSTNQSHKYVADKHTHSAEGLKRENIVITDIRVTPLSYVAPKDKYLWRIGGLVV